MEVKDRALEPEMFERLRKTLIIFSGGQYLRSFKAFDHEEKKKNQIQASCGMNVAVL